MRTTLAFSLGATFVASLWACRPVPPPFRPLDAGEFRLVWEDLARERIRADSAERRLRAAALRADLWRLAAERAGTPQSWRGAVVSTIYVVPEVTDPVAAQPELIPAPAVPVPTRPGDLP